MIHIRPLLLVSLTSHSGCDGLYCDCCAPFHACQYNACVIVLSLSLSLSIFLSLSLICVLCLFPVADSSGVPQQMIDDLQMLSEAWVSENRDLSRRGYEGSPMRSSPVAGLPNHDSGVPYPQSQASRRSDRADPPLPSSLDTYIDNRYPPQPSSYTTSSVNPSYTSTSGYPAPPPNYPTPQVSGYPSSGYAPVPGVYQQNAPYPQAPVYQTGSGYPSSSGYSAPVYPAPVGRTANPNDQNYTYDTGEYSTPGYQYRQQGAYPTGAPPRDPRADPRADPRSGPNPNYPYVSSPQDATMRGTAMDERYAYGQSMPTSQAGRGGFPTPARGTPTGGYDPPQPRDGFERETERRRR